MTTKLDDALRFHSTALNVRAYRQQILASNIANSDTPAYKARDIDFSAALESAVAERGGPAAVQLVTTSARHMQGAVGVSSAASLQYRVPVQASVDGNTVEMDVERAQFAENSIHYEASLTILGMEIKKLLAAIQG
jgi:flagellar basal-body rod protein FlgB